MEITKPKKPPEPIIKEFQITIDGDAIRNNTIDASQLANSLLGVSSLLEKSNTKLNGRDSELFVKVKGSFKPGSFEIDFITFVIVPTATIIVDTIDLIGFAGIITDHILSYIDFIKKTKGKSITVINDIDTKNCEVKIDGDALNNTIIVNKGIISLYNDKKIREDIYKSLSPLEHPGINSVQFKQGENIPTTVNRNELSYFKVPEPEVIENTYEKYLIITACDIEGEQSGWRFKLPDEHDFRALVTDESFLKQVKSGDLSFSNGQIIKAKVHEIQRKKKRWVPERTILEVLEIIPREKEEGVFPLDDSSEQ